MNFHLYEAVLHSFGYPLKRTALIARTSSEALATAQLVLGTCEGCTITVRYNPETFFECHG